MDIFVYSFRGSSCCRHRSWEISSERGCRSSSRGNACWRSYINYSGVQGTRVWLKKWILGIWHAWKIWSRREEIRIDRWKGFTRTDDVIWHNGFWWHGWALVQEWIWQTTKFRLFDTAWVWNWVGQLYIRWQDQFDKTIFLNILAILSCSFLSEKCRSTRRIITCHPFWWWSHEPWPVCRSPITITYNTVIWPWSRSLWSIPCRGWGCCWRCCSGYCNTWCLYFIYVDGAAFTVNNLFITIDPIRPTDSKNIIFRRRNWIFNHVIFEIGIQWILKGIFV